MSGQCGYSIVQLSVVEQAGLRYVRESGAGLRVREDLTMDGAADAHGVAWTSKTIIKHHDDVSESERKCGDLVGRTAKPGDSVSVHFIAQSVATKVELLNTRELLQQPFELRMGRAFVVPELEQAVESMSELLYNFFSTRCCCPCSPLLTARDLQWWGKQPVLFFARKSCHSLHNWLRCSADQGGSRLSRRAGRRVGTVAAPTRSRTIRSQRRSEMHWGRTLPLSSKCVVRSSSLQ